jgi:hypothetical protein
MKGPRSRHRHCVLRVWECPACQKRALAPVQQTTHLCECRGKEQPTWMILIEEPRRRPKKVEPVAESPSAAPQDQ